MPLDDLLIPQQTLKYTLILLYFVIQTSISKTRALFMNKKHQIDLAFPNFSILFIQTLILNVTIIYLSLITICNSIVFYV